MIFTFTVIIERGFVTHSSSRGRYRWWITVRYTVATAVQRRRACHTRTVLLADAYGRQRCNVVASVCSVVYLWYICSGLCARERGQQKQTKNYRYVRTK